MNFPGTGISEQLFRSILGAIFIALGSLAFYVSALISGRSLQRDVSPTTATLVSSGVGFLLFLLSPACFLLLDASLFPTSIFNSPYPGAGGTELSKLAVDRYLEHLLVLGGYYLVAAVGVGLSFGSWALLNARSTSLMWLRKHLGLRFGIRTYTQSWEDVLMGAKSRGLIHVWLKDGTQLTGLLDSFSTGEEPRSLVLEDCVHGPGSALRWLHPPGNQVLITEDSSIVQVEIPRKSMKRHQDAMSHHAQAFFVSLSAFGILLLTISCDQTGDFLRFGGYPTLGGVYFFLANLLLALSLVLLLCAVGLQRTEFQGWRAAYALAPATTTMTGVVFIFVLVGSAHVLNHHRFTEARRLDWLALGYLLSLLMVILGGVSWGPYWRLRRFYQDTLSAIMKQEEELFLRMQSWFYQELVIEADMGQQYNQLRAIARDAHWATGHYFQALDDFIKAHTYLRGEEYYLFERFQAFEMKDSLLRRKASKSAADSL